MSDVGDYTGSANYTGLLRNLREFTLRRHNHHRISRTKLYWYAGLRVYPFNTSDISVVFDDLLFMGVFVEQFPDARRYRVDMGRLELALAAELLRGVET